MKTQEGDSGRESEKLRGDVNFNNFSEWLSSEMKWRSVFKTWIKSSGKITCVSSEINISFDLIIGRVVNEPRGSKGEGTALGGRLAALTAAKEAEARTIISRRFACSC